MTEDPQAERGAQGSHGASSASIEFQSKCAVSTLIFNFTFRKIPKTRMSTKYKSHEPIHPPSFPSFNRIRCIRFYTSHTVSPTPARETQKPYTPLTVTAMRSRCVHHGSAHPFRQTACRHIRITFVGRLEKEANKIFPHSLPSLSASLPRYPAFREIAQILLGRPAAQTDFMHGVDVHS